MISKAASVAGRVKFRTMQRKDISAVIDIVKENYLVDHHEVPFMYSVDHDFMRVAELDGKIVGCSSAAIHGRFAVLGFLNVTKECRGLGVGQLLRYSTIDLIQGKHRITHVESLDKSDFKTDFVECKYIDVEVRYDNVKFERLLNDDDSSRENNRSDAAFIKFSDIVEYDARIHAVPRERFLKSMLNWPNFRTRVSTDTAGHINGYGTIKLIDGKYVQISPLFANSDVIARSLFVDLCRFCLNGQSVMFTTVDTNRAFLDETKKAVDTIVHAVAYRTTDNPTGVLLDSVYAVTSDNIAVI